MCMEGVQSLIRYDMIQYLCTAGGFTHGGSWPYTVYRRQTTVIYIKRNNTDHRTHTIESKACKTIKQK